MARKRAAEHDWICARCGCACDRYTGKHVSGGSVNMRACRKPAMPVLRGEHEAMLSQFARDAASAVRDR